MLRFGITDAAPERSETSGAECCSLDGVRRSELWMESSLGGSVGGDGSWLGADWGTTPSMGSDSVVGVLGPAASSDSGSSSMTGSFSGGVSSFRKRRLSALLSSTLPSATKRSFR